jgi:hypothetical protein
LTGHHGFGIPVKTPSWRPHMAKKIDPAELVTFKEFMLTNAIQLDTITQLLIDKHIITQEEFVAKLKQVQTDYMSRKRQ